ncbi:hypothetical protein SAMN05444159_2894 [Bradyrhizobium lablabi]|jgi:hypothetical protein|uniref:Uncharacterized protein n=1 Tax=Bradyrhizobium lablabi TaxID=722472 RepID=A0A1M6R738_9BRAD|nr:hypothetical protein [Bradyrhizobium lablabi]SHK28246.1 hypothetical protein SAMN05444159_2894 [Bradyrhizobium lablabi]
MSQLSRGISKGILGASAIALTFGAVQFASGRDLPTLQANFLQGFGEPEASINREAKADRAVRAAGQAMPTRTVSLRLDGFAATSFLIRVPVASVARSMARPPFVTKSSGARKPTVACEPVVSVLTEVAKQLQPGRCVT